MEVKRHFSTLRSETNCSIQVRPYEAIRKDLEQFVQGIQDDSMVWVSEVILTQMGNTLFLRNYR